MDAITSRRIAALGFSAAAWLLAAFELLPWPNALGLSVFACLGYAYLAAEHHRVLHNLLWLPMLLVGLLTAVYRPGDFHYPLISSSPQLHPGGSPFLLHINIAKALAGWLVVALYLSHHLGKPLSTVRTDGRIDGNPKHLFHDALLVLSAVGAVLGSAKLLLDLPLTPKWSVHFFPFLVVNLCATVVAEQAFFRLLMQRHMAAQPSVCRLRWCSAALSVSVLPIVITAFLFALVHQAGWNEFFLVYFIAGLVYASVYAVTRRFSLAVAVHLAVNLGHFLLLPYPLAGT